MTEIADLPLIPPADQSDAATIEPQLQTAAPTTTDLLPSDVGGLESPATPVAPAPGNARTTERFVRHANIMSTLTILSRFFGMIRDKVCATYLGNQTTEWSAFWMGFQLPNLFRRIFGEGALTAIFVPTYTRILHEKGAAAANRLAAATVTLLVMTLGGLTVVGEMIIVPTAMSASVATPNRLAALMVAIMLPYCVLICLVALLSAIATVHERFVAQAIAPIILNIAMAIGAIVPVVCFTHSLPLPQRIVWVAIAVIVAGIGQVALVVPTVLRSGVSLRPVLALRQSGVLEIARAMLPMILGLSAVQLNTYMDTQIAWWLSPDGHNHLATISFSSQLIQLPLKSGAVGILSVAQRIYMLPVGIFGVAMSTAIFPLLSRAATQNDLPEVKRLMVAGIKKTLFLSLPASVGMMFVARPLITTLYSSDGVERATWAAIWFCGGIWAFEAQMVILRVFYALHDRITPMKVAVGMVVLNFSLNSILVWFLQEGGIAASTTISAIMQSTILLFILRRRLGPLGLANLRRSASKGLIGCGAMLITLFALTQLLKAMHQTNPATAAHSREVFFSAFVALPMLVSGASITYIVAAMLLKMDELFDVPLVGKYLRRMTKPHATPAQ
jgi:putative peptidoglycan lipid II flippase